MNKKSSEPTEDENKKLSFNINKVICISLKSHNEQQLKAISEVYRIDFDAMIRLREVASKIWAESNGDYVIAYADKNNGESVVCTRFCPITKKEKDALYKIQPIKAPKMSIEVRETKKPETNAHLNVLMNKKKSEPSEDENKKLTFNINKVICISLKSHNEQQLKAISEVYKLDFKTMVEIKSAVSKIWVEAGGDYLIAFTTTDNDTPQIATRYCPITKKEKDALLKIQPIKAPKMPKEVGGNIIPETNAHLNVLMNKKKSEPSEDENKKLTFNINKVICISLKSHNDQQLKAISEVYKLDFNTLVKVKACASKIWIEAGGDYAIAFITTDNDTPQVSENFCPITKREKDALLKITPIKAPKMPKEVGETKISETNVHLNVLLNKKSSEPSEDENKKLTFNINNLICISLKSHNDKQILAIAATYDIDYNALINLKSEGCQKIWIPKGAGFIVAGLDSSNIEDVYFSPNYLPMTAKVRNSVLKVTPVKTPKMPKEVGGNADYIKVDKVGNREVSLSIKPNEQEINKPKLIKPKNLINNDILEELDKLIGLTVIKSEIKEQINYINFTKIRKSKGIDDNSYINLHSVFTGNPGTGKTTVVRLLGKIYQSMGVMKIGHVVEVNKANLIGQHIGATEANTLKKLEEAKGGILFIDEAYALVTGTNVFGTEVINTIITEMTNEQSEVTIIVAGYPEEMNTFIDSNPGLKSRFTKYFHFEDYQPEELLQIAEYTAKNKDLKFSDEATIILKKELTVAYRNRKKSFGNARYVTSLISEIKQNLAQRIMKSADLNALTPIELCTIKEEDIIYSINPTGAKKLKLDIDEELLNEAMSELNAMVGLAKVKSEMNEYIKLTKYYREIGKDVLNKFSLHTVFTGNPGTGKTTVARIFSKIYKALGLLERGHLIEGDRQALVKGYVGQTAEQTRAKINEAMGGVLFIDEAYALVNKGGTDFGKEAIEVLLKDMEDKRGQFALIVAGYTKEMDEFLESNPGLKSRFEEIFEFEDYTVDELYEIACRLLLKQKLKQNSDTETIIKLHLKRVYDKRDSHFGNGRLVRHIVEDIIKNYDLRKAEELQNNGEITSDNTILPIDVKDLI